MEDTKKQFVAFLNEVKEFGKQLFSKAEKFAATLADGTEITSDTDPIAVGSAITVNTPEGPAPMPDGEYPVMIDGVEHMMVCAGGFVTTLEPVQKEEEKEPEPKGEGEMNSDFSKAIAELETKFESRFAALEEALKISQKNALSAQKEANEFKAKFEKVGDMNSKILELIEQIGNETPAPITKERKEKTVSKEERLNKFRKEQGLI